MCVNIGLYPVKMNNSKYLYLCIEMDYKTLFYWDISTESEVRYCYCKIFLKYQHLSNILINNPVLVVTDCVPACHHLSFPLMANMHHDHRSF